jgi:hypothetical protein
VGVCVCVCVAGATTSMQQSSKDAAECLKSHSATAATDVTGFGLLGHLREMCLASQAISLPPSPHSPPPFSPLLLSPACITFAWTSFIGMHPFNSSPVDQGGITPPSPCVLSAYMYHHRPCPLHGSIWRRPFIRQATEYQARQLTLLVSIKSRRLAILVRNITSIGHTAAGLAIIEGSTAGATTRVRVARCLLTALRNASHLL